MSVSVNLIRSNPFPEPTARRMEAYKDHLPFINSGHKPGRDLDGEISKRVHKQALVRNRFLECHLTGESKRIADDRKYILGEHSCRCLFPVLYSLRINTCLLMFRKVIFARLMSMLISV